MQRDIAQFVDNWLPSFIEANRSYMTIAIGCTGDNIAQYLWPSN